jgi:hypothetical protein
MLSVPARSDQKWPDAQLRLRELHQIPSEGFLQRLPREVLIVGGVKRYDPVRVVEVQEQEPRRVAVASRGAAL